MKNKSRGGHKRRGGFQGRGGHAKRARKWNVCDGFQLFSRFLFRPMFFVTFCVTDFLAFRLWALNHFFCNKSHNKVDSIFHFWI
jgi:hypothetical protein